LEVRILPGRNVWTLARTDRDGVALDDVLQTTGAVLKRFLGDASPLGTRGLFEVIQSPKGSENEARFFIGAARPVVVTAKPSSGPGDFGPVPPGGELLAALEQLEEHMSVRASHAPWIVTASFDWRAPAVTIPWPRRAVNAFGVPSHTEQHGNDWLLLRARHYGAALEEDSSLSSEVGDTAAEAAKSVAGFGGKLLVVGGLGFGAYWLLSRGKR